MDEAGNGAGATELLLVGVDVGIVVVVVGVGFAGVSLITGKVEKSCEFRCWKMTETRLLNAEF